MVVAGAAAAAAAVVVVGGVSVVIVSGISLNNIQLDESYADTQFRQRQQA